MASERSGATTVATAASTPRAGNAPFRPAAAAPTTSIAVHPTGSTTCAAVGCRQNRRFIAPPAHPVAARKLMILTRS